MWGEDFFGEVGEHQFSGWQVTNTRYTCQYLYSEAQIFPLAKLLRFFGNRWQMRDNSSTNGTWRRLSCVLEPSEPIRVTGAMSIQADSQGAAMGSDGGTVFPKHVPKRKHANHPSVVITGWINQNQHTDTWAEVIEMQEPEFVKGRSLWHPGAIAMPLS